MCLSHATAKQDRTHTERDRQSDIQLQGIPAGVTLRMAQFSSSATYNVSLASKAKPSGLQNVATLLLPSRS